MKASLKLYEDGELPEPFVGPPVSRPLRLITKSIRPEKECTENPDADTYGLDLIRRAMRCIEGRPFVFFTSPRPELRSRVRTKKGLLWEYPKLRNLEALHGELKMNGNYTSLTSLVSLEKYDFADADTFITNWYRSVLIVSNLDMDTLFELANRWVREKVTGAVPLDFSSAFHDLNQLPSTAIFRYFGADNGRDESLAVVGHEKLLDDATINCLDLLQ